MIRLSRLTALGITVLAYFVFVQLTVQPALSQNPGSSAQVRGATKPAAKYLGCYADRQKRDLAGAEFQPLRLITAGCQAICREKGFLYAGTQYGSQCFCGNSFGQYGSLPESSCNTGCSGNPAEKCGGTWANSIYGLTGLSPPLSQRMLIFSRGIVPFIFAYLPHLISLALGFGLLLSLVGIGSGFWLIREYRLLKKTPQSSIRDIPMGFAHVRGKSAVENPLTSPLTQTPCCYYHTKIDHWTVGGSKSAGGWKEIFHEQEEKEFYLHDGTGKVLLNPKGAEYVLPELYAVEIRPKALFSAAGVSVLKVDPAFNRDNAPSEDEVNDYLTRHGATNTDISHLITEQCLLVGQEYGVFGTYDKKQRLSKPGGPQQDPKGQESPHLCDYRPDRSETAGMGRLPGHRLDRGWRHLRRYFPAAPSGKPSRLLDRIEICPAPQKNKRRMLPLSAGYISERQL